MGSLGKGALRSSSVIYQEILLKKSYALMMRIVLRVPVRSEDFPV